MCCSCTRKWRFSRRSCGCVFRVLHLRYKVAIFVLELQKCTSRALVLQSCDFRAGAEAVYFVRYTCTTKLWLFELELPKCTCCRSVLRALHLHYTFFLSWSCGSAVRIPHTLLQPNCDARRALHLLYKAAVFELRLQEFSSRTRLVLQRCDFRAGAAAACFACQTCTTQLSKLETRFACRTCATELGYSSWRCGCVLGVLPLSTRLRFSSWSCGSAGAAEPLSWSL